MPCTFEVGSGDVVPKVEDTGVGDKLASESSGGQIFIDNVADVDGGGGLGAERKVGCQHRGRS